MDEAKLISKLGIMIRKARQEASMNGQELASRIGMSQSYISEIERGNRSPSLSTLAAIAQALEKPISYFIPDPNPVVRFDSMPDYDSSTSLNDIIRRKMQERNMSLAELADTSGIGSTNLSRIMRGFVPTRLLIMQLAEALGEDENRMLVAAGYLPKDVSYQKVMQLLTDKNLRKIVLKIAMDFPTPEERERVYSLIENMQRQAKASVR